MLSTVVIDIVEARIALNTGNYQKAATLAESVMSNSKYELCTCTEDLVRMWTGDEGTEIIFQIFQSKDERGASWTDLGGLNTAYTNAYGVNIYDVKYIPTMEALNAYENTDIRKSATFRAGCTTQLKQTYMLNKYPGNPDLQQKQSDTYNTAKPFRLAEAYLIAAEAYYRNGQPAEALAAFNALHTTARGASAVTDITGFEQTLAKEYLLEYMGEGLAFSAYKRLRMSAVRGAQQLAVADQNSKVINITPDNKRWTWEIPQQDLFANSNIEKNWEE